MSLKREKLSIAYLVIGGYHNVANLQMPVFEMTSVEDVSVVDLNVDNLEISRSINDYIPCIGLLATGFCIEAGSVEKDTKWRCYRNGSRRGKKLFIIKYCFYSGINVPNI